MILNLCMSHKKMILPFVNSGQAPSSLIINLYCRNLENSKKYKYVYFLARTIDNIGIFLNHLRLIRIVEVFIIKLKNFFSQKTKQEIFN